MLPAVPVLRTLSPLHLPVPRTSERPKHGDGGLLPAGARSMTPGARRLRNLRLLSEMLCRPLVRAAIKRSVRTFRPDIVHALRIPFEGMLSEPVLRTAQQPFIVSIWGNDLTLFAAGGRWFTRATKRVLASADALHCDCERDVRLARTLGYRGLATVLPTCGGLDESVFPGGTSYENARGRLGIETGRPVIFNPRASREYTRHDIFFAALPAVLREFPDALVVTVGIDRDPELQEYSRELGVDKSIVFLPNQTARDMAQLYSAAEVIVSPTEHDGTPNSVLEAMACGSFPIVSDLESLREWIDDGVNGLVVNLSSSGFAGGIIKALRDDGLRAKAALHNRSLISKKATRQIVRPAISGLYREALEAGVGERAKGVEYDLPYTNA
jgi:glycosyltransferase involved in cell wall biosynthesis